MSLRDKIAAADDITYEDVEVPEWGVTLRVTAPNVRTRNELMRLWQTQDGEELDFDRISVAALVATCADPETGELVFSEDDAEMLLSKSGAVSQRVFEVASRMLGVDAGPAIEAKKGG